MSQIENRIFKISTELDKLKASGSNFLWKNIDLSELFLSEFVVLDNSFIRKTSFLNRVKLVFKGAWLSFKSIFFFKPKGDVIYVFINEINQLDNVKNVIKILNIKGYSIHLITTKRIIFERAKMGIQISSCIYLTGHSFILNSRFSFNANKYYSVIFNFLPKIDYLFKNFNALLGKRNIRYVLIGNDITAEGKLFGILANNNGIKTGTIQHGSINRVNPLYGTSVSSMFFVYGNRTARELSFLGRPFDSIKIVGWPLISDFNFNLELANNRRNFLKFNYDILLCFSGVGHSVNKDLHIEILKMIAQLQETLKLNVAVKLHPKDNPALYEKIVKGCVIWDNKSLTDRNLSILDLFVNTKCTITVASTAALESIMANIPVISIDVENNLGHVDFISDALTYKVSSYVELKNCYCFIANKSHKESFDNEKIPLLNNYFYNFKDSNYDPNMSIANFILEECAE